MSQKSTYEVTNATLDQLMHLSRRYNRYERIDPTTINVTMLIEDENQFIDWCEENDIDCRLI